MNEFPVIESRKLECFISDNSTSLVLETIKQGKQVLVFNNSKRSSESTAENIAKEIKSLENKSKLEELSKKILSVLSNPTSQCQKLARVVLSGVAFHHSGLLAKQRSLIEAAFKEGLLRVISSTPTLAAGLNLPAYKVIIKDYKRYSQFGFSDIPVLEFHQMAGRAGRPGYEFIGKAVVCVKTEEEAKRVTKKYVYGKPEEVISKLAIEPILKMYLLSLISMDIINTEEEIKSFFSNTLYAHQYQDRDAFNFNLFRILKILKSYGFIDVQDVFYMATPLGKKVSELYLNPDTAHYFYKNLDKFFERFSRGGVSKYDEYSVIYFLCNTLEMKPLFTLKRNEEEKFQQEAQEIGDSLIVSYDPFEMDYKNYLSLIKIANILTDWINEKGEDKIVEEYDITPGELQFKLEIVDWLLYCLEELSYLKKNMFFRNYLNKLRLRFKSGVREELLGLVSLRGIGRVRARRLFKAGFKKLDDIRKASVDDLTKIMTSSLAVNLKSQITENLDVEAEIGSNEKPKEIKVRDVSHEEIEILLNNDKEFEKDKKESQKGLLNYF